ncbi:hypothetical protein WJX81_006461 [Elliptochloris bilobata]|uniref:Amidohydrolase 3 domain-containing protein n=1 Tax=Elliptochloris bilobata TaxID=381761 RepID=A0AAW1RQW6_9CHLO
MGMRQGDKTQALPSKDRVPGSWALCSSGALRSTASLGLTAECDCATSSVFAVSGKGAILWMGNSLADAQIARLGQTTKLVNLHGAFVTPGFVDAHVHLLWDGLTLRQLDPSGALPEGVCVVCCKYSGATPEGGWVRGWGWSEQQWGSKLPDWHWLDAGCPKPVYLRHVDGHTALAN